MRAFKRLPLVSTYTASFHPTTGILNIDAEGVKEVSVIDVDGKVVMTENASVIDMTNLNNGVYFVRVISNEGMSIQKVVKK